MFKSSCGIFWLLIFTGSNVFCANVFTKSNRVRCTRPDFLPNGVFFLRRNGMVLRINCRTGYTLQGPRSMDCVNGKWVGDRPVCAKRGCVKPDNPEFGQIYIENDFRAILFCTETHTLAGNRFAYCNGTHWDRPMGNCREIRKGLELECDFETEDICGWVYEQTADFEWKRVGVMDHIAVFSTGPRHDHTSLVGSGTHYMLMESLGLTPTPVSLISPIYEKELSMKTACCFQFHYFMYGSGVGELYAFVKPFSTSLELMWEQKDSLVKFHKSGNQNNMWNMAHFSIDRMSENFQIVFTVIGAKSHLSDIAIDDVKVMTDNDCIALDKRYDRSETEAPTTELTELTEEAVFDTDSCVGRCFEQSDTGLVIRNSKLYLLCDCSYSCLLGFGTCCPDFSAVCLNSFFHNPDLYGTESTDEFNFVTDEYNSTTDAFIYTTTPPSTTTTTIKPKPIKKTTTTTTTTTTTAKIQPTTTTTTTTTTTPKPTRTTKTTTTTTPKPTTKSTTTTTLKPTTKRTTTTTTTSTTTTLKPTTKRTTRSTTTTTTTTPTTTPTTTTTTTPRRIFMLKTTRTTSTSTTTTTTTTKAPTTIKTTTTKPTTKSKLPKIFVPVKNNSTKDFNSSISYIEKQIIRRENITTFQVQSNIRPNHLDGSIVMAIIFVLILTVITLSVLYHRYKDTLVTCFANHLRSRSPSNADEECTSITAEFTRKSIDNNDFTTETTGARSKRKIRITRQKSDMETPLIISDDDVGLQNNVSSDL